MKTYNKLTTTVLSGHTVSKDIYLIKFQKNKYNCFGSSDTKTKRL